MLKSIRAEYRLIGAFILIIALTILGWITLLVYESQDENQYDILLQQNNIYIQQLPLNAQNYYKSYNNTTFKILRNNVSSIEEIISTLKNGGSISQNQKSYKIQAANGSDVQQQINAFLRELNTHKDQLKKLVANNLSQEVSGDALIKLRSNAAIALDYLSENNDRLVILNERISRSISTIVLIEKNRTRLILFIIILSIVGVSGFGVFTFRVSYLAPLQKMIERTKGEQQTVDGQRSSLQNVNTLLNTIREGMEEATTFAKKIGEGNLKYALGNTIREEPLGEALVEMRDRLLSFSEEESRQRWFNNGIAEISNLLNSYKFEDLEGISIEFLKFVIKYLSLNQGAIFLSAEEDANTYDMVACYAFDKKRFVTTSVTSGQGIIGQSIAEKGSIYTENVPNDYVNITSGLGTATPRKLLVVPVQDQEHLYGAVELASFQPISSFEIELIEEACNRFASLMANLRVSIKTQRLLDEQQRFNTELQSKEEQMLKNAKELEKTQKQLSSKLEELESETNLSSNIVKAINKTSATIEFDLNGNILDVNDMYLSIMGYAKDHLVGMNERLLVPKEELETNRYDLLWNSLKQGSFISGEYKRINKTGKEVWLNGTYNPIFNLEGEPFKVIQIAQFTTEEKEKDLDFSSKINALSSSFPLIDLDVEGKVLSGNATFARFLNYKRKEFRNKSFSTFLPLDKINEFNHLWQRILKGSVISQILMLETKEREIKYCLTNLNPIYNLSGKIYKVLVILIDITEQKQLELSLTQKEKDLSVTVNELQAVQTNLNRQKLELEMRIRLLNQAAYIFELDNNHEFTVVNTAFCNKLATTRGQLIHKPIKQVIQVEIGGSKIDKYYLALEETEVYRDTLPFNSFDGEAWWGDTTMTRFVDNKGNIQRFLGIIFDATQQVKNEMQLRESLRKEQAKNALLRNQSGSSEEALGKLLEQLTLNQSDSNIDTDKIVENDLLPTLLLDSTGKIIQFNKLVRKVLHQINISKDKLVALRNSMLLDWIIVEGQREDELIHSLEGGFVMEHSIRIRHDKDNLSFKGVFIPIFSNEKDNQNTLLIFANKF